MYLPVNDWTFSNMLWISNIAGKNPDPYKDPDPGKGCVLATPLKWLDSKVVQDIRIWKKWVRLVC